MKWLLNLSVTSLSLETDILTPLSGIIYQSGFYSWLFPLGSLPTLDVLPSLFNKEEGISVNLFPVSNQFSQEDLFVEVYRYTPDPKVRLCLVIKIGFMRYLQ